MRSCCWVIAVVLVGLQVKSEPPPVHYANYYDAKVTSVHDGDSFTCDTHLGRGFWIHSDKLRLAGLNAPELHDDGGREAGDWLRTRLDGKAVVVQTIGRDQTGKYGRLIATVWIQAGGEWTNVNQELIDAGHATRKNY